MPKAQIAKIVLYQENGNQWPALITQSQDTPGATCQLTVFGPTAETYRRADFSEEPANGCWSWMPQPKK